MKAVIKNVGEPARPYDGDLSYEFMVATVGGYIQMVPIGPEIDVVCNEEGMWAGPNGTPLPHNAAGFIGNILIVALDSGDEGECRDMTAEEQRKALAHLERFADAQHPLKDGGAIARIVTGNTDFVLKHKAMKEMEIWDSL